MGFPHGHRKTTTLVAGLRSTGMVAPLVIDGPINGEWFEAYVAQVLVPTLKPGDVVILDNLSSHKRPAAREMIEAAGARMLFLHMRRLRPIDFSVSTTGSCYLRAGCELIG
jgi:transposase